MVDIGVPEQVRPDDDVYARPMMREGAPKSRFPQEERPPRVAEDLVRDELILDGVARMNLATFCTTWAEPEVRQLMDEALTKNIIDKDEYPQTAELEARCVRMLADLWNSPGPDTTRGASTTGSSEAAMLGGLAAKFRWRARGGKGTPNFVAGPVQVCWEKFARYFDVEIREIKLRGARLKMEPDDVAAQCDENTIMVMPTFGQTFTGVYEDVKGISDALDELERTKGLDIPMHVDGASGAFLSPFVTPDLVWDFRLPRVKSINASGHKFGLAPLGSGWIVFREKDDLPEDLIFYVDYLGGNMPTFNLNFSRPGGQVAAQYYGFVRLGREGYTKIQTALYESAQRLAGELPKLGPFEVIHGGNPEHGIPAVSWRMTQETPWSLYDLADRLRVRGWQVPAYKLPADRNEETIQRALVRHGVSRDMIDLLIDDIGRAITYLNQHPPAGATDRKAGRAYSHAAHGA